MDNHTESGDRMETEDTPQETAPSTIINVNGWPLAVMVCVLMLCITAGFSVAMLTGVYTHENTLTPKERAAIARAVQPK